MLFLGRIAIAEPPVPFPRLQQTLQWHGYRTQEPGLSQVTVDDIKAAQEIFPVADAIYNSSRLSFSNSMRRRRLRPGSPAFSKQRVIKTCDSAMTAV